jgi:hypothetical protein
MGRFRKKASWTNGGHLDRYLRLIDVFGTPVQFTLKGEEKFKSCEGGVCTIAVLVIAIIYAVFAIIN